ncbi:MAG: hypothetical protein M1541_12475, partial [Acidobacteria bacterium]|nr:hypothetical protein [Acidobacteriota bacterium]
MKKSALLVALGAAGFFLALWKPAQLRPQPAQNLDKISQFRVVVGLKDTEAKSWQGNVSVTGGELAGLAGWRFSQNDRATPDGKFSFDTKIGQMENQLLTAFPFGQTDWGSPDAKRLIPEGLIVRVRGDGAGRVKIQTGTDSIEFASADVPFGKPLAVLGGNGMVERLPLEERLSESGTADDYAAVTVTPDGSRWVAWLAYQNKADTVMVSGGGKLQAVSGKGDHNSPAIASDGKGNVLVAWAENDFKGAFHIFARRFNGKSWSEPEKLTSAGSNIWPRLVSDGKGKVALVWQGLRNNQSVVLVREADNGRWGAERQMNEGPGNCWAPSAAYGGSKLWIAWDSYATGSYQIYVRQLSGPVERVTHGDKFSVRPSIAVMASGKP